MALTGLAGSEQALQAALSGQLGMMQKYGKGALSALDVGGVEAASSLSQARRGVNSAMGSGFSALDRAGQQAAAATAAGQADLRASEGRGLSGIRSSIQQGIDPLTGFVKPGQEAFNVQAALSGALGNEAQRAAFANYSESPEQAFIREMGQRQVLSGAAATLGLGGGEVKRELARFGTGLAAQDINNRFNRLGNVSSLGFNAANTIGNLRGQEAGLSSNLIGNMANARSRLAGQLASTRGQLGSAGAGLAGQAGSQMASLGQAGANMYSNLGANASSLLSGLGSAQAGMIGNTGTRVASDRYNTGINIANALGSGAANLANFQQQGGSGAADIMRASGGDIATLIQQYGEQGAANIITQAQMESNVAMNAAQALGGQVNPAQFVSSDGMMGDISDLAGGAGTLISAIKPGGGGG